MPDEQGNQAADEASVPQTPLHAYKEGREDDLEADPDALDTEAGEMRDTHDEPGAAEHIDAPPKH